MSPFIRICRPVNLLFILIIQLLFRWCIVLPPLTLAAFKPNLPWWGFVSLLLSTLLIAAAGYVVNDMMDTDIDRINKPEKVIVGEEMTVGQATRFYWILNAVALLFSLVAAISIHSWRMMTIQAVIAAILLFYAQGFKRKLLIGNLLVAFCAAMVIGILPFYELRLAQQMEYRTSLISNYILMAAAGYGAFAFFSTLVREIIKDIQDMPGDKEEGCKTFPIVFGVKAAQILTLVLLDITLVAVVVIGVRVIGFDHPIAMTVMFIPVLTGIYAGLLIWKAREAGGYEKASFWLKVWMLSGVLTMLVFKFGIKA